MSPRYFLTVFVSRPTVSALGDLVSGSETSARASIWDHEIKTIIGSTGELFTVTARGWFPSGTDVQRRDRVRRSTGQKYEVVRVVDGVNDRGVEDHIGVWLLDID
jgi:hypothetical protein